MGSSKDKKHISKQKRKFFNKKNIAKSSRQKQVEVAAPFKNERKPIVEKPRKKEKLKVCKQTRINVRPKKCEVSQITLQRLVRCAIIFAMTGIVSKLLI